MNKIRSARLHLLKFLFIVPLAAVLLVAFRDRHVMRPEAVVQPVVAETVRSGGVAEAVGAPTGAGHAEMAGARGHAVTGIHSQAIAHVDVRDTVPRVMVRDSIRVDVLYVVNGEKMPPGWNPSVISADKILSVDVVKGQQAVRLFGKQGANGVVAITLKDYQLHFELKDTLRLTDKNGDYKPLFIVDGKEVTADIVSALDPNKIESVIVHKADEVTRIYGDKGKNGVILITLKKEISIVATPDGRVAATMNTKDGPMTIIGDTLRINKP